MPNAWPLTAAAVGSGNVSTRATELLRGEDERRQLFTVETTEVLEIEAGREVLVVAGEHQPGDLLVAFDRVELGLQPGDERAVEEVLAVRHPYDRDRVVHLPFEHEARSPLVGWVVNSAGRNGRRESRNIAARIRGSMVVMPNAGFTLEWFGCTTFRVRVAGLTLWFDTFVDRVPAAEPVGLRSDEIDDADFVFVSHAHFDHLLGADTVAKNTGAPIIGSYESIRMMRDNAVEAAQLWPVSGGETIDCGRNVRVRVFPSLHSCLFAGAELDTGAPCLGDLGVTYQVRRDRVDALWNGIELAVPAEYLHAIRHRTSHHDGGQLNYLLETPDGTMFIAASTGYWSGIMRDLRADVAVLAATGRPNLDGEPFQGSMADFVVGEVAALRPERVVFCHHDAWMPPLPALDTGPVAHAIRSETPAASVVDLAYGDSVSIATR